MVPPGGTEITILIVRDACDQAALSASAKAAQRNANSPSLIVETASAYLPMTAVELAA